MIKLGKKVEYGLISLLHISALKQDELVTSRQIADRYRIPPEALGKVLQSLAHADLIESIQGAKGGYRLLRSLDEIVFGDVIEALEGPIHLTPCACENYVCHQESQCNIKEPVFHFQDQLTRFVFNLSLDTFRKKEIQFANTNRHEVV
jgi:Rrf2 family protein